MIELAKQDVVTEHACDPEPEVQRVWADVCVRRCLQHGCENSCPERQQSDFYDFESRKTDQIPRLDESTERNSYAPRSEHQASEAEVNALREGMRLLKHGERMQALHARQEDAISFYERRTKESNAARRIAETPMASTPHNRIPGSWEAMATVDGTRQVVKELCETSKNESAADSAVWGFPWRICER